MNEKREVINNDTPVETLRENFWELPLDSLNGREWEALCDGCGRCCLKKFEDEATQALAWTRVVCRYFDPCSSRCSCYADRTRLVPDCVDVSRMHIGNVNWMPATCAYRLRFENKPLFDWHPLLAKSREAMESNGIAVKGRVLSEEYVHPQSYGEHIIRWVKC